MSHTRYQKWAFLALLARLIVGGLFLVSAGGKIMDPGSFGDEVRDYQMLPIEATNVVAYILPWVELLAGALLVTTIWRREARFIIAALLVVFTIAKTWTYTQGIDIEGCGCGGGLEFLEIIYDTPQGILTNIVMLALLAADHYAQRLARRQSDTPQVPVGAPAHDVPDST